MKKVLTVVACMFGLFVFFGVRATNSPEENASVNNVQAPNSNHANKQHRINVYKHVGSGTNSSNTQFSHHRSHNHFANSVSPNSAEE